MKHNWSIPEAYLKHTWNILEAHLKHTWTILEVYFKHTNPPWSSLTSLKAFKKMGYVRTYVRMYGVTSSLLELMSQLKMNDVQTSPLWINYLHICKSCRYEPEPHILSLTRTELLGDRTTAVSPLSTWPGPRRRSTWPVSVSPAWTTLTCWSSTAGPWHWHWQWKMWRRATQQLPSDF